MRVQLELVLDWVWKLVGIQRFPQLDPEEKDLLFNWTVWPLWIEEFDGVEPIQSAGSSSETSD